MKKHLLALSVFILTLSAFPGSANAGETKATKEWTFLVFLNGHNNLDSFGAMNIKQMEEIGSTDKVNVVVQWASARSSSTKRLFIQKSTNPSQVTSPVVENMPTVDMGDAKELTKFIEWAAKNYPAKHYFVDVWNHGNGWHLMDGMGAMKPMDISYDDNTGHHITTEELGQSLRDAAKTIGQKIDIYGSDACLMAMAEVAGEMSDSVNFMVGSEEVEPGEGWPYSTFLKKWNAMTDASPKEVAKLLSKDYLAAYSKGGIYSENSVTMSAMDLSQLGAFNQAVSNLAVELLKANSTQMAAIKTSAESTQEFTSGDYKDLHDFLSKMESSKGLTVQRETAAVKSAINKLVISNDVSAAFSNAHGVAIWLPTSSYYYDQYAARYEGMQFQKATGWGAFLKTMMAR